STGTGTAVKPIAATRSKVTAWPGSSTMTRPAGVSQVARTRSIPSRAPPVTVRLAASMPSAASCAAARRRSRGATGASAYIRAGRRAGQAGSGGREAPAAQVAVGGGHRGRADAELAGQLADRRQLISRGQLPGADAGFHAGRNL